MQKLLAPAVGLLGFSHLSRAFLMKKSVARMRRAPQQARRVRNNFLATQTGGWRSAFFGGKICPDGRIPCSRKLFPADAPPKEKIFLRDLGIASQTLKNRKSVAGAGPRPLNP